MRMNARGGDHKVYLHCSEFSFFIQFVSVEVALKYSIHRLKG